MMNEFESQFDGKSSFHDFQTSLSLRLIFSLSSFSFFLFSFKSTFSLKTNLPSLSASLSSFCSLLSLDFFFTRFGGSKRVGEKKIREKGKRRKKEKREGKKEKKEVKDHLNGHIFVPDFFLSFFILFSPVCFSSR